MSDSLVGNHFTQSYVTAFTIHTLRWNSLTVVCKVCPRSTSTLVCVLAGERYKQHTPEEDSHSPPSKPDLLYFIVIPPYPSIALYGYLEGGLS
jgi:hypothetical protein